MDGEHYGYWTSENTTFKRCFKPIADEEPLPTNEEDDLEDYDPKGPDTEFIRGNIRKYLGPRVDESEFLPRLDAKKYLKHVDWPKTSNKRELNLRNRNVLLNRFLGNIQEENNNKIPDKKEPEIDPEEAIFINDRPVYEFSKPFLIRPKGPKRSNVGHDGKAIVDLHAVAAKLHNDITGASLKYPSSSSGSSASSSGIRSTSQSRLRNMRTDGGNFSGYFKQDPEPPPVFKPLAQLDAEKKWKEEHPFLYRPNDFPNL